MRVSHQIRERRNQSGSAIVPSTTHPVDSESGAVRGPVPGGDRGNLGSGTDLVTAAGSCD